MGKMFAVYLLLSLNKIYAEMEPLFTFLEVERWINSM